MIQIIMDVTMNLIYLNDANKCQEIINNSEVKSLSKELQYFVLKKEIDL